MLIDYHMHFEHGSYDEEWVKGFFESAKEKGVDEIGISEHSHGFNEFKELYYNELNLDETSFVGEFQTKWLEKNKFKCPLKDYEDFINFLKSKNYPVKFGIEVCNFQNQSKVEEILKNYDFDYIITSIHFIDGWGFDASAIKDNFDAYHIMDLYEKYVEEIEKVAKAGLYDVLGHPFNLRLFGHIPEESIDHLLHRAAKALKDADMAVDINTGTKYRYPIAEISPFGRFMEIAKEYDLDIIFSSDAHNPKHCGNFIKEAAEYAKSFGFTHFVTFDKRKKTRIKID